MEVRPLVDSLRSATTRPAGAAHSSVAASLDLRQRFLREVNQTVASLHGASDNAQALTASLAGFSADLNRKGSLPKDLVTDRSTYAALTSTVGQLQDASEHAATLMGGLAQGAADPGTPVGALVHDTEAGADVKATLDNLNESSRLLSEDLEAAQHNFLLRHFFKKKEKAAKKAAKALDGDAAADPDATPTP